ncbi:hypothetical protein [Mesonia sp.]|uniref:hypothetical protein n=1 Tax=Mesonia sp. TaxID=1960830 RepID=UPI003F989E8F
MGISRNILLVFLLWNYCSAAAQIRDVFQNEVYEISTRVLTTNFTETYLPNSLEYDQDQLDEEKYASINAAIQKMALSHLKDGAKYHQLFGAINQKLGVLNELSTDDYERQSNYVNPRFEDLEIHLAGVCNAQAIFVFEYAFKTSNDYNSRGDGTLKHRVFYQVNLKTGKLKSFDVAPNLQQGEQLREIFEQQLNALYLQASKKLDVFEVEQLELMKDAEINSALSQIDYREAKVYPYASGVLLEFEAYSESSKLFNGKSFRLFTTYDQLAKIKTVLPQLKTFFSQVPKSVSAKNKALFEAEKSRTFSLRREPVSLDFLDKEKLSQDLYKLEIKNYQIFKNGEEKQIGTTIYRFNENNDPFLIEFKDDHEEVVSQEKLTYFENGKVKTHLKTSNRKELEVSHYLKDQLQYVISFKGDANYQPNATETSFLDISELHYFYNENFQYWFTLNFIGKRNYYDSYQLVYVDELNENPYEKEQVLFNDNGEVVEFHYDHNRHHYFYSYDEANRITRILHYDGSQLKKEVNYAYEANGIFPKTIKKMLGETITKQNYFLEYR